MTEGRTPREIEAAERSAIAAAEAAEFDAEKKKAELEEWKAASQRRTKDAQATLEATLLKNAEAQRAAAKDLVPDLSKVDRGSTTVPESSTMFEALLAGRALQDAASKLICAVKGDKGLGADYQVLVTTELDLTSRDADYVTMLEQLKLLRGLVDRFMKPDAEGAEAAFGPGAAMSVAAAAAQVVPGLLSLLSAKRSVTSSSSSLDDHLVLMAVAGALAGADAKGLVVVEKAHLVDSEGEPHTSWAALRVALGELEDFIGQLEGEEKPDAERIANGKALLKSCQAASTAMVIVPEGANASPLAIASIQDAIHSDRFGGVLVVKGGAASATQLVNDRPLLLKDTVSIVSTATIAFLLINHRDGGRVLNGGLVHGMAQLRGKVGENLSVFLENSRG